MRKSYNKDVLSYFPECLSSVSQTLDKRNKSPEDQSVHNFLKAGIFAINNDKRRSVLNVPKTPNRLVKVSKENHTREVQTHRNGLQEAKQITISTSKISENPLPELKSARYSLNSKYHIPSTSRFRKNPNIENLKVALMEIEKNPPKSTELRSNKGEVEIREKSDIEKIMESQKSNYLKSCKSTKPVKLDINSVMKDENRLKDENSQRSDPSPVREKESRPNLERCGTSHNVLKKKNRGNRKVNRFLKKFEEDYMFKVSNRDRKPISPDSESSNSQDSFKMFDYQQESLKILKNTSSFASKIMKGIRTSARNKIF